MAMNFVWISLLRIRFLELFVLPLSIRRKNRRRLLFLPAPISRMYRAWQRPRLRISWYKLITKFPRVSLTSFRWNRNKIDARVEINELRHALVPDAKLPIQRRSTANVNYSRVTGNAKLNFWCLIRRWARPPPPSTPAPRAPRVHVSGNVASNWDSFANARKFVSSGTGIVSFATSGSLTPISSFNETSLRRVLATNQKDTRLRRSCLQIRRENVDGEIFQKGRHSNCVAVWYLTLESN